jgi:hypothetical protein
MPSNRKTKYSEVALSEAVANSVSIAGVLRCLGLRQAGGNHASIGRKIKSYGLDTSHFLGGRTNCGPDRKGGVTPLSKEEILTRDPDRDWRRNGKTLRRALSEIGREEVCEECKSPPEWRGKPLALHLDHRNGDFTDDREENLRFLCPNCHSQTETYCSKKKLLK